MLDGIGNTICNLELQIDWIEKHTANQIPGWANVTYAIREAIGLIKKIDEVLTDLRATNIRYSKAIEQMISVQDAEDAIIGITMNDGPEMVWSSDAIDAIKAIKKGV